MKTQNLNQDGAGNVKGSIFWHGRSWHELAKRELKLEWLAGNHAMQCHVHVNFGAGDSNTAVQFSISIPWLFSIYATLCGVGKWKREYEFGFGIHSCAFWIYLGNDPMGDWSSKDPRWKNCHTWDFPWRYRHERTEILEHKANLPGFAKTVFTEGRGQGRLGDGSFERRQEAEKSVSETYDYTYVLKNGTVQNRKAEVHVYRMTWRAKWWPLIPLQKSQTTIQIKFDAGVGEGIDSWKGGCVGCGWEMLHGETPLMALRRMESERKFGR